MTVRLFNEQVRSIVANPTMSFSEKLAAAKLIAQGSTRSLRLEYGLCPNCENSIGFRNCSNCGFTQERPAGTEGGLNYMHIPINKNCVALFHSQPSEETLNAVRKVAELAAKGRYRTQAKQVTTI